MAARAVHGARPLLEPGAVAAARAHAVARAELRCQTGRAAWQGHDGPAAGGRGDDLDGVARHGKGLTVHFYDRFEAGHLGDSVPRTAAHFAIHVLLQTGPAHSGHERTSVRRVWSDGRVAKRASTTLRRISADSNAPRRT